MWLIPSNFPRTRFTDGCEVLPEWKEFHLNPLEEQQLFLMTATSSLNIMMTMIDLEAMKLIPRGAYVLVTSQKYTAMSYYYPT